jgi:protein gp37
VDNPRWGRPERYKGELRLIDKEFSVKYGNGKSIFIESMNDMFAEDVDRVMIWKILRHCSLYPMNTYVFQTKNPMRYADIPLNWWPISKIIGTTIETNRTILIRSISKAPDTYERA